MAGRESPIQIRFHRRTHSGEEVETEHQARLIVVEGDSEPIARGAVDEPVFLRSSAKPMQTAAAVKSGLDQSLDLSPSHVAVMSSSHNGEPFHLDAVRDLLARGGVPEGSLRCGPHPSLSLAVTRDQARRGAEPTSLDSNCSGKHAGMLLLARHLGADPNDYCDPEHPVQRVIREAVRAIAELDAEPAFGVDGCSAPTFHLPLRHLAIAFRNLGDPDGAADPAYREALTTVRDAMIRHPELVAGTDRFDTDFIRAGAGRFISKIGAEGVVACCLPGRHTGIAIKIEDGAQRPYELLLLAVLERMELLTDRDRDALRRYSDRTSRNWAGLEVGHIEVEL